jgi:hypothetical protein
MMFFHLRFQQYFGVIFLCKHACLIMNVAGYKVGRVEQVETVSAQKDRVQQGKAASAARSADDKVVKRGMCGILTKGTLCDAELIGTYFCYFLWMPCCVLFHGVFINCPSSTIVLVCLFMIVLFFGAYSVVCLVVQTCGFTLCSHNVCLFHGRT